uniref:6,7-dimethyl-8-ribityllumazine synthase n=1 Tax=Flammulina velutipes TaxID=38945 RepID=D2JY93_FLAVE|nr:6,7-dimetjyl-8-ribityllumazine sythase [Flammulina velutipes]
MDTIKGLEAPSEELNGESLRVCIVHARWNREVIDALVAGALAKLHEAGVKKENIVVETVPGSFELPLACSKVIAGSHIQAASNEADLLGGLSFTPKVPSRVSTPAPVSSSIASHSGAFDAVIAIGVLIKGSTMHFEYICDAVSHSLMKLQVDSGVPVIFGVLTVLTDEQALERAGIAKGADKGHNHGEDWGNAAVEMGLKCKRWVTGTFA